MATGWGLRLPVGLLCGVLAVGVGACGSGGSEVSAGCAAAVEWNGHLYLGTITAVESGLRLGRGEVPGCSDTPDVEVPPRRPIAVWRAGRLDPQVAVNVKGEYAGLYVRDGFTCSAARCRRVK